jgi:hypothetical protein
MSSQYSLFLPVMVHIIHVILLIFVGLFIRKNAIARGEISIKYFQNFTSQAAPDYIVTSTRHLLNQFETPTLFYALCIMHVMIGQVTSITISLAWLYIGSRILHSMIHLSYNNVMHRMMAYMIGMVSLIGLVVTLAFRLMSSASMMA